MFISFFVFWEHTIYYVVGGVYLYGIIVIFVGVVIGYT